MLFLLPHSFVRYVYITSVNVCLPFTKENEKFHSLPDGRIVG